MTDRLKESISAIMDGEADDLELRRVLNDVVADPELCAKWERYHLISTYLRGEPVLESSAGVRAVIRAGIEDEPSSDESAGPELDLIQGGAEPGATTAADHWRGRLTAFAVAASVALAVVVGFNMTQTSPESIPEVAQSQIAPANMRVAPAATFSATPSERDIQRARAYMLHHTQQSALSNPPGSIPFVKMATYQSQ